MHRALSEFAHVLRRSGIRVSAATVIDAGRALDALGDLDRDEVREVMSITLAQRRDDIERVEAAFDRYFTPPIWKRRRRKRKKHAASGDPDGTSGRGTGDGAIGRVAPAPTTAREAERRAARGVRRDRDARTRRLLREADRDAGRRSPYAAARRRGPDPERRSGMGVLHKPFRERWSAHDEHALTEAVARALGALRLRAVRRRRQHRRGRIDVRRVMRRNLQHGGVPFIIPRTKRRIAEPDLLLIVDVSGSVTRAAAGFFALATRLDRAFRHVRLYVFVDRAVDATAHLEALAQTGGHPAALENLLEIVPDLNLAALSDYGRVLYQIAEMETRRLRRNSMVVVLGDARTNRADPVAWALESLAARARRVLWLNPEPIAEWDRGDSVVAAYAPWAEFIEIADLDSLRHACAALQSGLVRR